MPNTPGGNTNACAVWGRFRHLSSVLCCGSDVPMRISVSPLGHTHKHACCLNQQVGHFDTSEAWCEAIKFMRSKLLFMGAYLAFSLSSWNEAFVSNCLYKAVTASCQLVSCLIISHLPWTHAADENYLTSSKSSEGVLVLDMYLIWWKMYRVLTTRSVF